MGVRSGRASKGKSSSSSSSSGSSSSSSSGSSGSSSSGGSSGGSSSKGGQGGARASRSSSSPSNASSTSGSSSTTTGANTQSVASVSGQQSTSVQSSNPLTQGANRGLITDSQNASETARADAPTFNANPTIMGAKPNAVVFNTQYQNAPASQYPTMVAKYGVEVANKLATQTYYTRQQVNAMSPASNTDNQYLQNESGAITHAQERQTKFVDSNQFLANPQPKAHSEKPNKIYTSTNLYQQAGQDDNPLSILEGNPFVNPSQQFLPQVNEEFAPRPVYTAFTNNPYIGVHQNSPLSPNANIDASQRKGISDYATEIRSHKYFPLLVVGIVVIIVIAILRKRGK